MELNFTFQGVFILIHFQEFSSKNSVIPILILPLPLFELLSRDNFRSYLIFLIVILGFKLINQILKHAFEEESALKVEASFMISSFISPMLDLQITGSAPSHNV